MLHDILFALWFLLPAALANVAPILVAPLPLLRKFNLPLDFHKTFQGQAIFGPNKTWRGLVSGIVTATITLWLQQIVAGHTNWFAREINYDALPTLLLGPLFGLGALGGDALESFFKRRRGIPSGKKWIPFDQLDYIVGGVLMSLPFVVLRPALYVWIFALWFVAHLGASYVGWQVGLKKKPI